jgi:hypothetical protein
MFRQSLLLFLTSLMTLTSALDRRPTISFITQPEIVADIGGRVEMLCSVQYAQDYPVIWMKLDQVDRNNDLVRNNLIHCQMGCELLREYWAQSYNTFFVDSLRIFVIGWSVCHWQTFQA